MRFNFRIIFLLFLINYSCLSYGLCKPVPVTELESGVYEFVLSDVRIKLEPYNQLFKMKLIGAVNEDWTSASLQDQTGLISGYIGNGESAQLKTEVVANLVDGNIDFSIFRKDSLDSENGIAYFVVNKHVKCIDTTYDKWSKLKNKFFSQIATSSSINLEPDGFL
jgi:hypothetical protein